MNARIVVVVRSRCLDGGDQLLCALMLDFRLVMHTRRVGGFEECRIEDFFLDPCMDLECRADLVS